MLLLQGIINIGCEKHVENQNLFDPFCYHCIFFECKLPDVKEGTIIEMPKESESFKKKDNSSSEMIVIAPNPRVEEVLISDQPSVSSEALTYEARLNEKLKDLDLYEEDMTIQQKEELLEVVIASWETAEKEKTRRQFFQDYMTASEAFCNDQFEFTLQESEEISNAIRCADIPLPPDPPQPSISGFSGGFGSGAVTVNGNFDLQFDAIASSFDSAMTESKSEKAFPQISVKPSSEIDSYDIRESKSKLRPPRRGRSKRGRASAKEILGATDVINAHSGADGTKRTSVQEASTKQPLEKSISLWKPCLSPKDTPLTCSRRPMPEEKDASCYILSEEEYSQKVFNVVRDFDIARKETRKACAPKRTYGKPYHLTRRGLFVKKSGKLDKYDTMIGVSDTGKSDQSDPGFLLHSITKGEPFSRTSEGAHRYTKSNRSETILSQTNTPVQTTRSGVRYGFQKTAGQDLSEAKGKLSTEITNESSITPHASVVDVRTKDSTSAETIATPIQRCSDKDALFDSLLPKCNNVRTDISTETAAVSNGPFQRKKGHSKSPASSKKKSNPQSSSSGSQNHIVNSCVDSDSSNSSVIDVETVVDDEINEFVLKRKMLQNYSKADKESSGSKRTKKGSV